MISTITAYIFGILKFLLAFAFQEVEEGSIEINWWKGLITCRSLELKKQSFLLGLWLIIIVDGTVDSLEICLPWSLFFKWKFGIRIIGVKGLIRLESSTTTSLNATDAYNEKKKQLRDLDENLFVATQSWKAKLWWEIIKYIGVRVITKFASIFFLCVQDLTIAVAYNIDKENVYQCTLSLESFESTGFDHSDLHHLLIDLARTFKLRNLQLHTSSISAKKLVNEIWRESFVEELQKDRCLSSSVITLRARVSVSFEQAIKLTGINIALNIGNLDLWWTLERMSALKGALSLVVQQTQLATMRSTYLSSISLLPSRHAKMLWKALLSALRHLSPSRKLKLEIDRRVNLRRYYSVMKVVLDLSNNVNKYLNVVWKDEVIALEKVLSVQEMHRIRSLALHELLVDNSRHTTVAYIKYARQMLLNVSDEEDVKEDGFVFNMAKLKQTCSSFQHVILDHNPFEVPLSIEFVCSSVRIQVNHDDNQSVLIAVCVNRCSLVFDMAAIEDQLISVSIGQFMVLGLKQAEILRCGELAVAACCHLESQCYCGYYEPCFEMNLKLVRSQYAMETAKVASGSKDDSIHSGSICGRGTSTITSKLTYFSKDSFGNLVHGFYRPAMRHVILELKVSHLSVTLHLPSAEAWIKISSERFQPTFCPLSAAAAAYSSTRRALAEVSMARNGKPVELNNLRISSSMTFKDIRLKAPAITATTTPARYVEASIHLVSVVSGDYLESFIRESSPGSSSPAAKVEFALGRATSVPDAILRDLCNKVANTFQLNKNPIVRSYVISLCQASIAVVKDDGDVLDPVMLPWTACGTVNLTTEPSHPDFSDVGSNVYGDELIMEFDAENISTIATCVTKIVDLTSSLNSSSTQQEGEQGAVKLPRYRVLAGLSMSKVQVELDALEIMVCHSKDTPLTIRVAEEIEEILSHLTDEDLDWKLRSVQWKIARSKLLHLGVPLSLLKEVEADNVLSRDAIQQLCQSVPDELYMRHILCKISLGNVIVHSHQLFYDLELTVKVSSLQLHGQDRCSILEVKPIIEDDLHGSSALEFSLILRDRDFSFGKDGIDNRYSVHDYYRQPQHRVRIALMELTAQQSRVQLNAAVMIPIVKDIIDIYDTMLKSGAKAGTKPGKKVAQAAHNVHDKVKCNVVDILIKLDSLECVLACKNELFAELRLGQTAARLLQDGNADTMSSLVIHAGSLLLVDLTPENKRYREAMWICGSDEENCQEHFSLQLLNLRNGDTRLVISATGINVCFLYRFLNEFILVIQRHIVALITVLIKEMLELASMNALENQADFLSSVDEEEESEETEDDTVITTSNKAKSGTGGAFVFTALLNDCQLLLPRHTRSEDIAALAITAIAISIESNIPMISTPTGNDISNPRHLYYDLETKNWAFATTPVDGEGPEGLFEDCRESTGTKGPLAFRIAIDLNHVRCYSRLYRSRVTAHKEESPELGYIFSCDDIDFLKVSTAGAVRKSEIGHQAKWIANSRTPLDLMIIIDLGSECTKFVFCDSKRETGIDLALSQAELYLIIAVWFENAYELSYFEVEELQKAPGEVVRAPTVAMTTSTGSKPRRSGRKLTMSDSKEIRRQCDGLETFGIYGSLAYLEHVLFAPSTFEILLIKSYVRLSCALDVDHFDRELPFEKSLTNLSRFDRESVADYVSAFHTVDYINNSRASMRVRPRTPSKARLIDRQVIPLCDVIWKDAVLQVSTNNDSTRLHVAASCLEVYDLRSPSQSAFPLYLRVASSEENCSTTEAKLQFSKLSKAKHVYGLKPFFGFDRQKNDFERGKGEVPLELSMISCVKSNWITVNLGLDQCDVNLNDIDGLCLIGDFFSCFFRFPEFGHPGVAAYSKVVGEAAAPYGGFDFRLFLSQPHIDFMADLDTEGAALLLECEQGVYFRYKMDTVGNSHYTLTLNDIAMIMMKRYRPPIDSRGARGSSGSGRGVRTVVEFLNIVLSYHSMAVEMQSDLRVDVYNTPVIESEPRNRNGLVDFIDHNLFHTDYHVTIPEPQCMSTVNRIESDFAKFPADVIICYEDMLVMVSIIKTIFRIENEESKEEEELGSPAEQGVSSHVPFGGSPPPVIPSPTAEVEAAEVPLPEKFFRRFSLLNIRGTRLLVVDNVLGLHLPLLQIFVDEVRLTHESDTAAAAKAGLFSEETSSPATPVHHTGVSLGAPSGSFHQYESFYQPHEEESLPTEPDLKVFIASTFWIEYFNNLRKCWEPFTERLALTLFMEKSTERGIGFVGKVLNAFHANLSGALLKVCFDLLRTQTEVEDGLLGDGHISNLQKTMFEQQGSIDDIELFPTRGRSIKGGGEKGVPITPAAMYKSSRRRRSSPIFDSVDEMTRSSIQHRPSYSLDKRIRVGFSILNLTGQPTRYLQHFEDGRRIVQYLNHGGRGMLNFVAAHTIIRNYTILEETFEVQQSRGSSELLRAKKSSVGNHVALQVSGFRWLHAVQADELGVRFEELLPVLGSVNPAHLLTSNIFRNSLRLMVEVVPYYGGRMLKLRSVFSIKNSTSHAVSIHCRRPLDDEKTLSLTQDMQNEDIAITVDPGETIHLPLALLHSSVRRSKGKSLGLLKIKPSSLEPIVDELSSRLDLVPGKVEYSVDSIDLMRIVQRYEESSNADGLASVMNASNQDEGESHSQRRHSELMSYDHDLQLCCHVLPKTKAKKGSTTNSRVSFSSPSLNSKSEHIFSNRSEFSSGGRIPPFTYSVEVNAENELPKKISKKNTGPIPLSYMISIYAPIIIENLLPMSGVFELVHAEQKKVLWSSCIAPGTVRAVHTVTLDEPLLLLVNLRYCRSSEGVLVHEPRKIRRNKAGFASKLQRALEGFLDESSDDGSSIFLTDAVGQKIRLGVDNVEGGGGHRHITIFSPYWIVNTSQFSFRLREEGDFTLPAGTVTPQREGTRPVPMSSTPFTDPEPIFHIFDTNSGNEQRERPISLRRRSLPDLRSVSDDSLNPVFPGCCGPLHNSFNKDIPQESFLSGLLSSLNFHELRALAYPFNFREENNLLSSKRVRLQLDDTEWSSSFSLDGVGVMQTLGLDHSLRGKLEVGISIDVAPGKLTKYTKIVRMLPRFIVHNQLDSALKVMQVSSIVSDSAELEVPAGFVRPYHLPEVFGDRMITIQVEGQWQQTVPFRLDYLGGFTVELKKKLHLASISHINTRGAPEYTVIIPASRLVGVAFETDWGEQNIIVKSIQYGSFAQRETDIRPGDVLLSVDGERVEGNSFELAMVLLKNRLRNAGSTGCTIKLRTVEENLRLIREHALVTSKKLSRRVRSLSIVNIRGRGNSGDEDDDSSDREDNDINQTLPVRVEMRQMESTVAIIVTPVEVMKNLDYIIENKSVCYKLFYKQKGILGNSWACLNPGEVRPFYFEDPFKPHKLLVHVGDNILSPSNHLNNVDDTDKIEFTDRGYGGDSLGAYLSLLAGVNVDSASVVNLDEIGGKSYLSIHRSETKLVALVKSEGPTKVLLVSPSLDIPVVIDELEYGSKLLQYQQEELRNALAESNMLDTSENLTLHLSRLAEKVQQHETNLRHQHMTRSMTSTIDLSRHDSEVSHDPLISAAPFVRLVEAGISRRNQLLVEVLEAKDLSPTVHGRLEDIYCSVYMKCTNPSAWDKKRLGPLYFTYVCDHTLGPDWVLQKFLFDLREGVHVDHRLFNLRVNVCAKSVVGVDVVIGKLDVPLSCLREEKNVEGWFPLRSSRTSVLEAMNGGSIRLRLKWIYSEEGLRSHLIECLKARLDEVRLYRAIQSSNLKRLKKFMENTKKFKREVTSLETYHSSGEDLYSFHVKRRKESDRRSLRVERMASVRSIQSSDMTTSKVGFIGVDDRDRDSVFGGDGREDSFLDLHRAMDGEVEEKSDSEMEEKRDDHGTESFTPPRGDLFPLSFINTGPRFIKRAKTSAGAQQTALFKHDEIMVQWLSHCHDLKDVLQRNTVEMRRSKDFAVSQTKFIDQFDRETKRSFAHVFTKSGILEVLPLQALYVTSSQQKQHESYIKVSYGGEAHTMYNIGQHTWYIDEDGRHPIEPPKFHVDTLNIKGMVILRIKEPHYTSSKEIARVEIPMLQILSVIANQGGNKWYDMWYPLITVASSSKAPAEESDPKQMEKSCEKSSSTEFGYDPCIHIKLRWRSEQHIEGEADTPFSVEEPKFYGCVQIPSFSLSFIDSGHARSVMLATIVGLEIKRAVTREHTDLSLYITDMQVDNQLPDPSCPIILSPTIIKAPQPVIRLHLRMKNLLSQESLACYEFIQMVVQEIDLRLEQQTVIASWDLMKNWLNEIANSKKEASNGLDSSDNNNSKGPQALTPPGGGRLPFDVDEATNSKERKRNDSFSVPITPYNTNSSPMIDRGSNGGAGAGAADMFNDSGDQMKLYIENFQLFPIQVNVSFLTTPVHIMNRFRKSAKREKDSSTMYSNRSLFGFYSALSVFFWQVGEVVMDLTSSISNAPIYLNGFEVPHLFKTYLDVSNILQEHYLHSALFQLYKIVVSLDLVGNPLGLVQSLGSGVKDFFYEPAHALITSPTELGKFGKGVVKGTVSLITNTTDGFLGTGTNITRSFGRGFAKLSMDQSYLKAREGLQKAPNTFSGTVMRPVHDIANGFVYGISGVVKVPYASVKRYGVSGLPIGMAQGLVGLTADPVVGVLDAVTHTGEAVRSSFKYTIHKEQERDFIRRRLSDLFGPDGRILPYDYHAALGVHILQFLHRNRNMDYGEKGNKFLMKTRSLLMGNSRGLSNLLRSVTTGGSSQTNDEINSGDSPNNQGQDDIHGSRPVTMPHRRQSMVAKGNRFSFRVDLGEGNLMSPSHDENDGKKDNNNADNDNDEDGGDELHNGRAQHAQQIAEWLYNLNKGEFVIYSGALRIAANANSNLVVIITKFRVLVVEYGKKRHDFAISKKWIAKHSELAPPRLDRRGSGAELLLRNIYNRYVADEDATTGFPLNRSSTIEEQNEDDGSSPMRRRFSSSVEDTLPSVAVDDQRNQNQDKSYNKNQNSSYYRITGSYQEEDILKTIYNCIQTILGSPDPLLETEEEVVKEDQRGVRHIGPWEFDNHRSSDIASSALAPTTIGNGGPQRKGGLWQGSSSPSSSLVRASKAEPENTSLLKALELECWVHDEGMADNNDISNNNEQHEVPFWLLVEQRNAVMAHRIILEIHQQIRVLTTEIKQNRRLMVLKAHLDDLTQGRVSYDEFLVAVEETRRVLMQAVGQLDNDDIESLRGSQSEQPIKKDRYSRGSIFGVLPHIMQMGLGGGGGGGGKDKKRGESPISDVNENDDMISVDSGGTSNSVKGNPSKQPRRSMLSILSGTGRKPHHHTGTNSRRSSDGSNGSGGSQGQPVPIEADRHSLSQFPGSRIPFASRSSFMSLTSENNNNNNNNRSDDNSVNSIDDSQHDHHHDKQQRQSDATKNLLEPSLSFTGIYPDMHSSPPSGGAPLHDHSNRGIMLQMPPDLSHSGSSSGSKREGIAMMSPSPIRQLPAINTAAPRRLTIMIDGESPMLSTDMRRSQQETSSQGLYVLSPSSADGEFAISPVHSESVSSPLAPSLLTAPMNAPPAGNMASPEAIWDRLQRVELLLERLTMARPDLLLEVLREDEEQSKAKSSSSAADIATKNSNEEKKTD